MGNILSRASAFGPSLLPGDPRSTSGPQSPSSPDASAPRPSGKRRPTVANDAHRPHFTRGQTLGQPSEDHRDTAGTGQTGIPRSLQPAGGPQSSLSVWPTSWPWPQWAPAIHLKLPQTLHETLKAINVGAWLVVSLTPAASALVAFLVSRGAPWVSAKITMGFLMSWPTAVALAGVCLGGAALVLGATWFLGRGPSSEEAERYLAHRREQTNPGFLPLTPETYSHTSALALFSRPNTPEISRPASPGGSESSQGSGARAAGQLIPFDLRQMDDDNQQLESAQRAYRQMIPGMQTRLHPYPVEGEPGEGMHPTMLGYNDGQGYNFVFGYNDNQHHRDVSFIGVVLNQLLLTILYCQWNHPLLPGFGSGESYLGLLAGSWPASVFTGLETGWVENRGLIGLRVNAFYNGSRDFRVSVDSGHVPAVRVGADSSEKNTSLANQPVLKESFKWANGWGTTGSLSGDRFFRGLLRVDQSATSEVFFETPLEEDEAQRQDAEPWRMGLFTRDRFRWWFYSQLPTSLPRAIPALDAVELTEGQRLSITTSVRTGVMPTLGYDSLFGGRPSGGVQLATLSLEAVDLDKNTQPLTFTRRAPRGPRWLVTWPAGLGFDTGSSSLTRQTTQLALTKPPKDTTGYKALVDSVTTGDSQGQAAALKALTQDKTTQLKREVCVDGRMDSTEVGLRVSMQPSDSWWSKITPPGFAWGVSKQWRQAHAWMVEDDLTQNSRQQSYIRYFQRESLMGPRGQSTSGAVVEVHWPARISRAEALETTDDKTEASERPVICVRSYHELSRADAYNSRKYVLGPFLSALQTSAPLTMPAAQGALFGAGWCHGRRSASLGLELNGDDLQVLAGLSIVRAAEAVDRCAALNKNSAQSRQILSATESLVKQLQGDAAVNTPDDARAAGLSRTTQRLSDNVRGLFGGAKPGEQKPRARQGQWAKLALYAPDAKQRDDAYAQIATALDAFCELTGDYAARLLAEMVVVGPTTGEKALNHADEVMRRLHINSEAALYSELLRAWESFGIDAPRPLNKKEAKQLCQLTASTKRAMALATSEPLLSPAARAHLVERLENCLTAA